MAELPDDIRAEIAKEAQDGREKEWIMLQYDIDYLELDEILTEYDV